MPPARKAEFRAARALPALALLALAATAALAAPPSVGERVPDLSLLALDDSQRTLSDRTGPTVLVFFRGVW